MVQSLQIARGPSKLLGDGQARHRIRRQRVVQIYVKSDGPELGQIDPSREISQEAPQTRDPLQLAVRGEGVAGLLRCQLGRVQAYPEIYLWGGSDEGQALHQGMEQKSKHHCTEFCGVRISRDSESCH